MKKFITLLAVFLVLALAGTGHTSLIDPYHGGGGGGGGGGAWSSITGTPTTLSGYGITDGVNLQTGTPGTAQTGNLNITGHGIFGLTELTGSSIKYNGGTIIDFTVSPGSATSPNNTLSMSAGWAYSLATAGATIDVLSSPLWGAYATIAGLSAAHTKTFRDFSDTVLELGGSYTPTGTWTGMTLVTPALGTPASGTLTSCTGYPWGALTGATAQTEPSGGWVGDEVHSPGNITFTPVTAPTAPTAAQSGTTGVVTTGTHTVKVTYLTASGETVAGTASNTVNQSDSVHKIDLTGIPVSTSPTVTGRNIYMNKAAGSTWYLVSNGGPTLNNNLTTTYSINVADATLGTGNYVAAPSANSTAGYILSPVTFTGAVNCNNGLNVSNASLQLNGQPLYSTGSTEYIYSMGTGFALENTNTGTYGDITLYSQNVQSLIFSGNAIKGLATTNGSVGTCTLTAGNTTTVSNTRVTASSLVFLTATNAGGAAATLMPYISAVSASTSFTITTVGTAAGTETFNYLILN